MKTLKATSEGGTATIDGKTYEIVGGYVEVDDGHVAELVTSHGFSEGNDEGEDPHDLTPTLGDKELALSLVDKMDRPQLLGALRGAGVLFTGGRNNVQLRSMLKQAIEDHGRGPTDEEIAAAEAADKLAAEKAEQDVKDAEAARLAQAAADAATADKPPAPETAPPQLTQAEVDALHEQGKADDQKKAEQIDGKKD